ncbi:MAG: hypothetical protein WD097_10005 [Balneolales bacterium]
MEPPFPDDNRTLFYFSNNEDNPLPVLSRNTPVLESRMEAYSADRVVRAPKNIVINHPPDFEASSTFTLFDHNREVVLTKTLQPEAGKNQLYFHTDNFPAGIYTMKLSRTDNNMDIYSPRSYYFIDDPDEPYLKGVIEIFSRAGAGLYNLFTSDGKMRSPVFDLQFNAGKPSGNTMEKAAKRFDTPHTPHHP